LPGIVSFFQDINIPVELGDPLKAVSYRQSLAPVLKRSSLSLSIAIGLALRKE
jgi:Tfp pilus assembly PilM family ATPase